MTITNFPNGISSRGAILGGGFLGIAGGQPHIVNPTHPNASDENSGTNDEPLSTVPQAHANATAGQHDTVYYIAGSSSVTLQTAFTWSKAYTHLIGVCAPTRTAQRSRIFQLSSLTGASPLLTISASGCYFENFYIFQGVADATSLINVSVTGGRNYFNNVHFAGGGHATQAVDGGASLKLDGSSSEENTFVNCTIGVDTIDAATGMVGLLMDDNAHRNTFDHCTFRMRAGNSGAAFVEVADATGIDRDTTFDHCNFINNSTGNDMAAAFLIPAMGEPRSIQLINPYAHNISKWDANDRGVLFGNVDVVSPVDLSGVAKELVT